jgi:hypothetical protein
MMQEESQGYQFCKKNLQDAAAARRILKTLMLKKESQGSHVGDSSENFF